MVTSSTRKRSPRPQSLLTGCASDRLRHGDDEPFGKRLGEGNSGPQRFRSPENVFLARSFCAALGSPLGFRQARPTPPAAATTTATPQQPQQAGADHDRLMHQAHLPLASPRAGQQRAPRNSTPGSSAPARSDPDSARAAAAPTAAADPRAAASPAGSAPCVRRPAPPARPAPARPRPPQQSCRPCRRC